jgi:parallel beta-helix repeat protein
MKRYWFIILLLTLFLSSLNISISSTIKIESKLSDLIVDNEGDGNFYKIQEAINQASTGDTIYVYSGKYQENLVIDKKINLIGISHELGTGADVGKPIIDGEKRGDVITVEESKCIIQGLEIINSGLLYKSGINIQAEDTKILNNTLKNNHMGVYLSLHKNCSLINNTFGYNGFGIQLNNTEKNTIKYNTLENTGFSFVCNASQIKSMIIENNTVNKKPIYIFTYLNNKKIANLDAGQIIISKCNNLIIENISIYNTTIGIVIQCSSNLIIRNNSFSNIHRGGVSLHAKNCEIYYNDFYNCSFSIYLEGGCTNIYLHHNNFVKIFQHDMPVFLYNVKRQAFVNVTNIKFDSNFWDEWIGLRAPFMRWMPKFIPGYINSIHKRLRLPPIYLFDKNPALEPY